MTLKSHNQAPVEKTLKEPQKGFPNRLKGLQKGFLKGHSTGLTIYKWVPEITPKGHKVTHKGTS